MRTGYADCIEQFSCATRPTRPQAGGGRPHEPATWRDVTSCRFLARPGGSNTMWQSDHIELDILMFNHNSPTRPSLTAMLDDQSHAMALPHGDPPHALSVEPVVGAAPDQQGMIRRPANRGMPRGSPTRGWASSSTTSPRPAAPLSRSPTTRNTGMRPITWPPNWRH